MANILEGITAHIDGRRVEYIKLALVSDYYGAPQLFEGELHTLIPQLNIEYDGGFGRQELFGYIWYTDGSWSERGEYDGSEWWEHKERPSIGTIQF
jgi:hypothetical protein